MITDDVQINCMHLHIIHFQRQKIDRNLKFEIKQKSSSYLTKRDDSYVTGDTHTTLLKKM